MNVSAAFPASWRTDIEVTPGAGRDRHGNPRPSGEPYVIPSCLIGSAGVAGQSLRPESSQRSDAIDSHVHLYGPAGYPLTSRDTVTVRPAHYMAGTYEVEGDPMFWPLGTEAVLRRVDASGDVPRQP